MAITAQNVAYQGSAPVAGGSGVLAFGGSSNQELAYIGTVTFTGDGATTSAVANYLDGSNALPFTPTAVIALRAPASGGDNAASSIVSYATATNNIAATITYSAAPANGTKVTHVLLILK